MIKQSLEVQTHCLSVSLARRCVIAIITDIDAPRAGLLALDERPLLELNETCFCDDNAMMSVKKCWSWPVTGDFSGRKNKSHLSVKP
jgi:hypothetical protein